MGRRLAVLDLGEIVDEETSDVFATFVPTPENVGLWEAWVDIINAHAKSGAEIPGTPFPFSMDGAIYEAGYNARLASPRFANPYPVEEWDACQSYRKGWEACEGGQDRSE